MAKFLDSLNIVKQCRRYGVGLWQCPHFLFLVMGAIIISSIIATYLTAQWFFTEPQLIALIVLVVAAILFVIGHIIVSSFERVAEASLAKSEFVAIMSHQIKTPLSIIKWQLNLLKEKGIKIEDSEAKKFFIHLDEENQRMIHIVNDLLELNRIEDSTIFLNPSVFSLKEIIDEVVGRRRKENLNTNVSFEIKTSENLPLVFADKIRTRDVVSHIIDNAIRYSINGGKITVMLQGVPKCVCCSVRDEGIGISKEDQKRIFSKFFRAESVYKYQTQGLGLRLYLAKAIVEASGGKIGFTSQEGKGSTFWFTLPVPKNNLIGNNYQ